MFKLHVVSEFDDLDCAFAAASILKNDNPDKKIFIDDWGSLDFFVAEIDDNHHVTFVNKGVL